MYACGEKVLSQRLKISHTLYKYLIYFVIMDSSAVIVAFASLTTHGVNEFFLLAYLFTILASSLLLLGGD
jgi:NADH:ubiquinone oxidoreductase subunit 3 (subunit A)